MAPALIGLTGPNASGKGVAADYLAQRYGYARHSLSDVLRAEARRRGLQPVRETLIALGNALRREHGAGALAEAILPDLRAPALVDSIRNPQEVAVLRGQPGFVLVAIQASLPARYGRSLARQRVGDAASLAEFVEREGRENTSDPTAQQLDATALLADHVVRNDGTLEDLHAALDVVVAGATGA